MKSAYDRLSVQDQNNFWVESAVTPMHIIALLQLEPGRLLDTEGHLNLDAVVDQIDRRLASAPRLRQVVSTGSLLTGPPLWIDEAGFDLRRHVHSVVLPSPGSERHLLDLVARIDERRIDRAHALWEIWLVTGLASGNVALIFKLHHAIADGLAAIALIGSLLDFSAEGSADSRVSEPWKARPAPRRRDLIRDNLNGKRIQIGRALKAMRPAAAGRSVATTIRTLRFVVKQATRAPRSSLNRPIGARRRLEVLRIPLDDVKSMAHAHGGKVNDVMLALIAGGLRALLSSRGDRVQGVKLVASVPVSLRNNLEPGNEVGVMMVPLSIDVPDAEGRLSAAVVASRSAKRQQSAAGGMIVWSTLARTGIAGRLSRSQRFVNVFATNVAGPPVPVYVLGARVLDVVPVTTLAGNCTIGFAALSYNGTLVITAVADAELCPDLDVVMRAIDADWQALRASRAIGVRAS